MIVIIKSLNWLSIIDLEEERIIITLTNSIFTAPYIEVFIDDESKTIITLTGNGNFQLYDLLQLRWIQTIPS